MFEGNDAWYQTKSLKSILPKPSQFSTTPSNNTFHDYSPNITNVFVTLIMRELGLKYYSYYITCKGYPLFITLCVKASQVLRVNSKSFDNANFFMQLLSDIRATQYLKAHDQRLAVPLLVIYLDY